MSAITQHLIDSFNTLTAGADLDTQGGFAKMAGSGTTDFFVIANTTLEGAQCIAVRNAAASQLSGYEKSIGQTRTAGTDHWRITWLVRINATAVDSENFWVTFSAGAGSAFLGIDGNNALAISFIKVTNNVYVRYADNSASGFQTVSTALGAEAVTMAIRVEMLANNTYELWIDADNDGEGWVLMRQGTLKSGNEAISRYSVQTNAPTSADDTLLFDRFTFSVIQAETKVSFDERVPRMGKLPAGGAVLNANGMVDMTVEYYNLWTGSLDTTKTVSIPLADLTPSPGRNPADLIDKAIEEAAVAYDAEARVATLAASGHNKGF